MLGNLKRDAPVLTAITLTNALATTPAIDLSQWSGIDFYLKPSSAITGMAFYACADPVKGVGGTTTPYMPCTDDVMPTPAALAFTGLVVTAAGLVVPGPTQLFPKVSLKVVITGVASEAVDYVRKG